MPDPKKNVAYTYYLGLVDQTNRPQFRVNPTLAAGDFQVSIDGAALAPLATTPVVSPAGSRIVKVDLSAGEMNGGAIIIVAHDQAGSEWDDVITTIQTTLQTVDDLPLAPAIADTVLTRSIQGGGFGGRTVQDALRILRNNRTIVANVLTVYQEDDITPAWTANIATAPGNPVTQVDPL